MMQDHVADDRVYRRVGQRDLFCASNPKLYVPPSQLGPGFSDHGFRKVESYDLARLPGCRLSQEACSSPNVLYRLIWQYSGCHEDCLSDFFAIEALSHRVPLGRYLLEVFFYFARQYARVDPVPC